MSRARATALALINWKGVFYERYLLDRNVTALEGANGAGKTTVMIAAYVVLLPDLARLRFTNLGETGATSGDKGIWGRLGDPARPSYAALQVQLGDGSRVLMGVHLERKAEPTLHLSPFLISDIADDVRVQDLLLLQSEAHDEVPTLDELKISVVARGARLQVFSSAKEYFGKLFELGIGPLRLSSDEERNKWNEMLRTSMTGGISRALTSELRSFVFKQDTGLSDTLGRMRSNLNACRQTRTEVAEARILEHEISGIYDSGLAFFASALLAAREQAREALASLKEASRSVDDTRLQLNELEALQREFDTRRASLADRVAEADRARAAASEALRKLQRARQMLERLSVLDVELDELKARAASARETQELAVAGRRASVEQREAAQLAVRAAAEGLAHLQSGLDELHKQVHAHRLAKQQLALIERELSLDAADTSAIGKAEVQVSAELRTIDAELARRDRELSQVNVRRAEFLEASSALSLFEPVAGIGPLYPRARAQLQRLNALETKAQRIAELSERQRTASDLGIRQLALSRRVLALGIAEDGLSSAVLADWVREQDLACRQLDEQLRKSEWQMQLNAQEHTRLETELAALERRRVVWEHAEAIVARLSAAVSALPRSREGVREQRATLEAEREELQRRIERCQQQREQLTLALAALEVNAGVREPALLEVCEALEGELLSRRYDELEIEQARHKEAALGELVDALVVESPEHALVQLAKEPPVVEQLWLLKSGSQELLPRVLEPDPVAGYVAVQASYGIKLTRLPEQARLGQLARQRGQGRLRQDIEEQLHAVEALESRLTSVERALRDIAELQEVLSEWLLGTPGADIDRVQAALTALDAGTEELRKQSAPLQRELADQRASVETGRSLLADAYLLDMDNQTSVASNLGDALSEARDAMAVCLRLAEARKKLTEMLEVLRNPVASDEEIEVWRTERAASEARRDVLFTLKNALVSLQSNRAALNWTDAERCLSERVELAPELEAAHARAMQEAREAEKRVAVAEQAWEASTRGCQQANAALEAALAHAARMRSEVDVEGVLDASDQALAAAVQHERVLAQRASVLGSEAASIAAEVGRAEERLLQARARLEQAETRERSCELAAKPAQEAHDRAAREATLGGVLQAALGEPFHSDYAGWTSAGLAAEARGKSALLIDRLQAARGGGTLSAELGEQLATGINAGIALKAWQHVRGWLTQRVPARISDQGDPLEALHRLRDDLRRLEVRLTRQETDLRGNSEDVARNIDVQTRKAGNQIRRLNQYLRPIHFGSIAGIRIKMGRVERLDQVLLALREGSAQELLFQSNLPIEEALDEIFKRYGGGRGGGHRLLDYREYIELSVEIQRSKDADWELANPSRLSTGEAIGVGAALMMVILTEWERDANLLRAERTTGTLRFLFLDEANRLSRDNLGTLFELCQTLELQLLIAAPEVAHVDGNTTYRLVRRVTEDGREEVIASGRRASLPDEERAEIAPTSATAEQVGLGFAEPAL